MNFNGGQMKVEVVMPKMGESVNEGTIIKWHKKVGDKVDKDEIIFEISTDKVDTEIPSPASGVLAEIKVFEQETVPVGTVVALIETDINSEIKPVETTSTPTEQKSNGAGQEELIDVVMPKMGESVTQGTIIKWHKKVGDKVAKDETLFEISTDKVDTEVPSPAEGVLAEILVKEQETVDVGVVVARISPTGYVLKVSREEAKVESRPSVVEKAEEKKVETVVQEKTEKTEKSRFYSPLVLNIARQEGISFEELETIEGTGLGGRVTKKDILNYIEMKKAGRVVPVRKEEKVSPKPPVEQKIEVKFEPGEKVKIEPMDHMRQLIMEHMVKSRDTSVHVVGIQEVDMTKVHNYIQKNKEAFLQREGIKLTYLPFIVDATVKALKEFPYVNASIDGTNVILKNYINIGIAVALEPMGLIVPVIKNADEKNITGLAKSIYDLATRARSKKLLPDEVKDSTFTITNYGLYGTLFGNPIINQPEVAILGVGAVTKKPVVVEVDGQDTIAIRHIMYISLCHDHRLIDGALAGKFMRRIKELLENFEGE